MKKALLTLFNFIIISVLSSFTPNSIPACKFVLTNDVWDNGINIWVKEGAQSNCDQKADYGNGKFFLAKGQSITVDTQLDICWRRESQPGTARPGQSNVVYEAAWNSEACFGGTKQVSIR